MLNEWIFIPCLLFTLILKLYHQKSGEIEGVYLNIWNPLKKMMRAFNCEFNWGKNIRLKRETPAEELIE